MTTDLGGDNVATGLALQGGDKVVASGSSDADLALARYLAP